MPFEIVRADITQMHVDAIVNAANSALAPGGGVCGAIFAAAGYENLNRACRGIGHCNAGQAVITDGYALPARYVIHAVGPVWQGGGQNEAELLRRCYCASLRLADEKHCRSVAFPLISSGRYGYPKAEALRIATGAIREFLTEHEMQVYLTIFDRDTVMAAQKLHAGLQSYIDDHYVQTHTYRRLTPEESLLQNQQLAEQAAMRPMAAPASRRSLENFLDRLEESFSHRLLRLVDEKGMTDVEVYKRANLDRKLFSKIRKDGYNPSKQTAIALAVALRLSLDETRDLLGRAGYSLSRSNKFDIIIEYFISEGNYDIYEINEALFAFDQRLLGA